MDWEQRRDGRGCVVVVHDVIAGCLDAACECRHRNLEDDDDEVGEDF